ncbi:hypothetical protein Mal35_16970 [Gimesia maris]|uniref:hypothetical protein n=1 Tax=Gimesia maris TaxID=122 RepID=UPI0011881311|nr:hypothetical protein [Gimesia maris]QDT78265.1 hypothetical protein Mal35_16970 [Gimesia maris]
MDYGKENIDALDRWKRGHKVFFLLLQGLIVNLRRFQSAVNNDRYDEADRCLQAANQLLSGTARVMKYTGDFSKKQYETDVRPTMCPPYTIDGFSGLLSRDHAELLQVIRDLRPVFASLPTSLAHSRRIFFDKLSTVYDCHVYVCERFVGSDAGSLRMNESTEKSSTEVLKTFKENRLKPISPSSTNAYPFWEESASEPS